MKLYSDKIYKDSFLSQPKDDIPAEKKNETWCLDWCKYIYSYYLNDKCGFKYSNRDYDIELRSYASGEQSSEIYKDILLGEIEQGKYEREGFVNVNFDDIFSPAPKYINVIQGMFEDVEHDIIIDAIDEKAGTEKENKKEELWFRSQFRELLEPLKEFDEAVSQEEIIPQTRQELELFSSMGGFKLRREVALEKGISFTEEYSKWKELKRKIIRDLVTLNKAAIMDEVDPYTQKVKYKYIDVIDLIIEYSSSEDFDNSRFGGVPIEYTISDLRSIVGDKISEEELEKIAYSWADKLGNPIVKEWGKYSGYNTYGGYGYDSFRVQVLYCAWKSTDEIYVKKNGFKVNGGKVKKSELKSGKIKKIDLRRVYHGYWIVGTEHIFKSGIMNDIPRPKKNDVALPFHAYLLKGKSTIENMKPILDQVELTFLKLQSALALAPPNGLKIELGALENITIGDKKMHPLDLIKIRRQTGDILYRATTHHGQFGSYGQDPIRDVPGGIGPLLNECISLFELYFNHIAELTGIDRITTASKTPTTTLPVGTQQMAAANTNTVLKPVYTSYLSIKENAAKNAAYRIQLICLHNKDPQLGYEKILGKANVQALAVDGCSTPMEYGLRIIARPTEEMKKEIKIAAIEAMKVGKNGQPGITMGEYLFLTKQLNYSASIDYARAYLTYREAQNKERDIKVGQENIRIQSEEVMKQKEQKHNQEKDLITHKTNEQIRLEQARSELKIREESVKQVYNREIEREKAK